MGKVFLITGSSSGIGLALCKYFHVKGHTVYGMSRSLAKDVLHNQIQCSVSSNEVEQSVKKILEKESRIDVLINNAGIGIISSIEDFTKEDYTKLMDTNVWGAVNLIKQVLPSMRKNNSGQIINISSIASNYGLPFRGYYSASKSAVNRLTEALRSELYETNIQICALNLGSIDTDIAERRLYSDTSADYKEKFERVLAVATKNVSNGKDVEKVVLFIEQMLSKEKWKPSLYFGARMEKLSILLKKIASPFWFEKSITKYAGLKTNKKD